MNSNKGLKELSDISFEAKKIQLKTLIGGGSSSSTGNGSATESSLGQQQLQPSPHENGAGSNNNNSNSIMDRITESHDAWRLFSKAKNALEDGARLENLSWRLFHMKLKENSTNAPEEEEEEKEVSGSTRTQQKLKREELQRKNPKVKGGKQQLPVTMDQKTGGGSLLSSAFAQQLPPTSNHITSLPLQPQQQAREYQFKKPDTYPQPVPPQGLLQSNNANHNNNHPTSGYPSALDSNNNNQISFNGNNTNNQFSNILQQQNFNNSFPYYSQDTSFLPGNNNGTHPSHLMMNNQGNSQYYFNEGTMDGNSSGTINNISFLNGRDDEEISSYSPHSADGNQLTPPNLPLQSQVDATAEIDAVEDQTASDSLAEVGTSNNDGQKSCGNCETSNTVLWRRDGLGGTLCNACGLFFKLHSSHRPLRMKTDVIRKRNRKKKGGVDDGGEMESDAAPITTSDDSGATSATNAAVVAPAKKSSSKVAVKVEKVKIERKSSNLTPIETTQKSDFPPKVSSPSSTPQELQPKEQPPRQNYQTTGKRGRAEADQGLPYTDSATPNMYIPSSTPSPAVAVPLTANNNFISNNPNSLPRNGTVAPQQVDLVNRNTFNNWNSPNEWQAMPMPMHQHPNSFLNQQHQHQIMSNSFNAPYDFPTQNMGSGSFGMLPNSLPMSTDQWAAQQPQSIPTSFLDNSAFSNGMQVSGLPQQDIFQFQKQPLYPVEATKSQSLLFHTSLQQPSTTGNPNHNIYLSQQQQQHLLLQEQQRSNGYQ